MAVSKTHPPEALLEAYAAGQRLFGENRVQEWQSKQDAVRAGLSGGSLDMHLIGPLQSNKTARAAELFTSIDTLDQLKTAERLHRAAGEAGRTLPVLIEVKLSPEEAKHGVAPGELKALLTAGAPLQHIELRGLMTVPPFTDDPAGARPYFARLRELRDQLQPEYPALRELSMGMSHDFAVAISEGSTCVRVGTAIFGKRE